MATKLAKIIADFRTALATTINVAGESATILSATDDDGVTLPTGKYYLTIDGDNNQKEHIYATLTGSDLTLIKSISRQGAESTGCVREHRIGATVTMTDFAHIKRTNDLLDGTTGLDGSNPLAYDTEPTITDDKEIATKKYVDNVALGSAPDANTTTAGVSKIATQAEIDAGTEDSVDGSAVSRKLVVNPKYLKDSIYKTQLPTADQKAALAGSGTPSASNKFVTADTDALKQTIANLDTTTTLGTSDTKYPSQLAVKTYVDTSATNVYLGSQNLSSGANTITAGYQSAWKYCIISSVSDNTYYMKTDLLIYKTGKRVATFAYYFAGPTQFQVSATFDGTTTITIAQSGINFSSAVAYYYQ